MKEPTSDPSADPWERAFVQNMVRARTRLSWSQNELARRLKDGAGLAFHQQTVQRIEAGQRPLRLSEALSIAKLLGMGDIREAASPAEPEAARSALAFMVKLSSSEYLKTRRQLSQLLLLVEEGRRTLVLEVKAYKEAAVNASTPDTQLVDAATSLADAWLELDGASERLRAAVRRDVALEEARGKGQDLNWRRS